MIDGATGHRGVGRCRRIYGCLYRLLHDRRVGHSSPLAFIVLPQLSA